ncbi:hypothetical protein ATDW_28580 [Asticcacaulis sp. DW145]|uniref:DUF4131 domain-containing protein n=1 Tax=Asticcacaulis currens TaxID=2984210 RepID=A0ABT5IL71_9CAUL|nr:DUF4131 domain-containing protein [Asticcacaulis currens]MDC7696026.1 DUF4131 domain-containing protein [Asticcacaulis currens]BEV12362.1 hypothetical protein ATDW_28580 [Asticcacaulis sp. DW145]
MPVAPGVGCAAYLSLRFEPPWLWVVGAIMIAGGLYALALGAYSEKYATLFGVKHATQIRFEQEGRRAIRTFCLLLLMVALGVGLCKLRTHRVAAPVLAASQMEVTLEAVIVDIVGTDTSEPRLLLAPLRLSGVAPEQTPIRVRLSLRALPPDLAPGQAISVFAILHPPAGPSLRGGMIMRARPGPMGSVPSDSRRAASGPWRRHPCRRGCNGSWRSITCAGT